MSRLPIVGVVAIAMLILLGVAGMQGGWALMHPTPDGSALGMGVELPRHSPFTSYCVPGVLLFGVFGVGSLIAALAGVLRHWTGPYLAFAIGVGQTIWIAVQLLMVQAFHPMLHPGLFCWGGAIATLAFIWWRRGNSTR